MGSFFAALGGVAFDAAFKIHCGPQRGPFGLMCVLPDHFVGDPFSGGVKASADNEAAGCDAFASSSILSH